MDKYDIKYAEKHLAELIERAVKGEDVQIIDGQHGPVWLTTRAAGEAKPFVPLRQKRVPGRLEGKIPPLPDSFFDPMTEDELKLWYGEDE